MNPRIKAFYFISRCLTRDARPASIAALRTEMQSAQLSWEAVVTLSNGQLVTPALWVALEKKGLTGELPGELRTYLGKLHQLNRERNAHLRAQLLEAVRQLNRINITPVLLKGGMHLVSDMYGDPGARIMSDIDLLVPRGETERCMASLQELQYKAEEDIDNHYHERRHHCAPLSRPGAYGFLEMHRDVLASPYDEILSTELALAEAEPLVLQGYSMKVLSPTHRALHNLLHSQLTDRNHHAGMLSLRSLHEMVTESAACHDTLNWSTICSLMARKNRSKILRTYLYQAHRLLGFSSPEGIQKTPDCWLNYWLCIAGLRWQLIESIGGRIQNYSACNIRRQYDCNDEWVPVNLGRLRRVKSKISTIIAGVRQR
jgi:hypothetical protein